MAAHHKMDLVRDRAADHRHAPCLEVVKHAGEEFVDDLCAPGQQCVGVSSLRHAAPMLRGVGEVVAFDDGDPLVGVCQHSGGEQSAHARAEDHRVVHSCRGGHGVAFLSIER